MKTTTCSIAPLVFAGMLLALLMLMVSGCQGKEMHGGMVQSSTRSHASPSNRQFMQYPGDWPELTTRRSSTTGSVVLPAVQVDEVWVIAQPGGTTRPGSIPRQPRVDDLSLLLDPSLFTNEHMLSETDRALLDSIISCGGMIGLDRAPAQPVIVPMPLQHTEVRADIAASIASVEVTQQYVNPYDGRIEAVYVFPLPQDAAVHDFVMTIGERTIRGIVREREEAEAIYAEARRQGYRAALLTQERPNIFTQKVANLEPRQSIDIQIKYFHAVARDDNWYEFVFPMVVGPRFNPPGTANPVLATPRTAPPSAASPGTDVRYLAPHERSGHDIMVNVNLQAGLPIESIASSSHAIQTIWNGSDHARVRLAASDTIPNKDFVLRYRLAGESPQAGMVVHRAGDEAYLLLTIEPPSELRAQARPPLELYFVVDVSGSMSGTPLAQAKEAINRGLQRLNPGDTFQIVRFDDQASKLFPSPQPATPGAITRGREYVSALRTGGGTMMLHGLRASLDPPADPERQRYVVLLTDGYIGNDQEVLGEIVTRLGDSRLFSFGVGSSVNRFLLDSAAAYGQGAAAYLGPNDSAVQVMDAFCDRVAHPALEQLVIDWGGLPVREVFPQRVPDLFLGRPITVLARVEAAALERHAASTIRVTGLMGRYEHAMPVQVRASATVPEHPGIEKMWARAQMSDLAQRAAGDANLAHDLPRLIRTVALRHGLLSAYTAFIAVDSSEPTRGTHGTSVPVAVPVPEGVRYETTVNTGGF